MKRILALLLLIVPTVALAQKQITVKGVVSDESGPLIGASVVQKGTLNGVQTDLDGKYSISVPDNATLVVSFIGLSSVEEQVSGRAQINVQLTPDTNFLEEVVVVGYGVQKKGSVTGSVSAINSEGLITTKSENVQNMLTGKVAGLRVMQNSAEPGSYNTDMDIRGLGAPLIVIDGVVSTTGNLQRLNPSDIENISVLKDAAASIYGVRGANGVVLVTTKTGGKGQVEVNYNGSFTAQFPSGLPKMCSAYQEMTLYNEDSMNTTTGGVLIYRPEDFQAFASGERVESDWNNLIFADWAPQTQHDVSVSGGNDLIQFYGGFGYNYQQSFLKSGDLNYRKFNLRSNVTVTPVKGLKINFNLRGYLDRKHDTWKGIVNIIRQFWQMGVLKPAYIDKEQTMLNYDVGEGYNAVAMMTSDISGYKSYENHSFDGVLSASFDIGEYVEPLKGLSVKILGSYNYDRDNNEKYKKQYEMYTYNTDLHSYEPKIFAESSPSYLRIENYGRDYLQGQAQIMYNRTFAEKHEVGAMVGGEITNWKNRNHYGYTNLAYDSPYLSATNGENVIFATDPGALYDIKTAALIGRLNYSYDNRYLIEGQFRYDGSSKFAPGHQWGFFPSFSLGWRISEEPWFKSSAASFINQLKLRFSYGVLGDDSGADYQWLAGYIYPSNSAASSAHDGYYEGMAPGYYFGQQYYYGVDNKSMANENITWYTCKTMNAGIDFEAWRGLLGVSVDFFKRERSGLFASSDSAVPTIVGVGAPTENINSDSHFGFEVEMNHHYHIGPVQYGLKGLFSVTRHKYLTWAARTSYGNSYDEWRSDTMNNRYQGIAWGLQGAGRYTDWNDIWNYDVFHGAVLPGGYKYEDWNGDGYIDGDDLHPMTAGTPWLNYSLNVDLKWKNLDFTMLFQGTAMGTMTYEEPLYSIWGSGTEGGTLVQYWDRWHPTVDGVDPYDQTLEWIQGYYGFTGDYPDGNSSFNRVKTNYLRLKTIELGYTLPKFKNYKKFNLRIFLNAYNIFTITGVKFVDPEHPDTELGRLYPLNKTVTGGINLTF